MMKISKNRKKKLRKRKKKQRELLEKQLYEVEGLDVSVNANLVQSDQEVISKIPDSILNEKIAPIPRINAKTSLNTNGINKEHKIVVAEEEVPDENNPKKKKKKVSSLTG